MEKHSIIFDGECNLCNGVVAWLWPLTPKDTFEFVAFQSPYGKKLLRTFGFPQDQLTTVILVDETGAHTHSDGFLKILGYIPKYRLVATLLAFIPRIFRDVIYNAASKNRVRWFGKSKSCTIGV